MIGANAPDRANWEVIWLNPKTKKLKRMDFGHNLSDAMEIYLKVKGKRKFATLRCKNFGFEPPQELQPRTVVFKKPQLYKGRKIRSAVVVPMKKKNREGIYWCPYCRELRRFKIITKFQVGNQVVHQKRFVCPVCRVSTLDHHVRKWNPDAIKIQYEVEMTRIQSPKGTRVEKPKKKREKKKRKPYKPQKKRFS